MTRMQNYLHYLKQLFESNSHQLFHIHKYLISHDNVYWRIISVSGKLPTYPSPKPTLTPTSHLRQNVVLGEEAGGQFPRNIIWLFSNALENIKYSQKDSKQSFMQNWSKNRKLTMQPVTGSRAIVVLVFSRWIVVFVVAVFCFPFCSHLR